MLPPLPFTARTAMRDFEFHGFRVHAGDDITIAPLHTHDMPSLWTNPEKFDPMRFSPERAEHRRHRFGYVPFGGGVHKCLGMRFAELELNLILVHALRDRRVERAERLRDPALLPLASRSERRPADSRSAARWPVRRTRVRSARTSLAGTFEAALTVSARARGVHCRP